MLQKFKKFIMRGNVIDLSVAVIVGGAFGKIVTSLVNDMIMPVIGIPLGFINFRDLKLVLKPAEGEIAATTLNYGAFIQNVVDFLIIAFCIFTVIQLMDALRKKEEVAPAKPAEPAEEIKLLTEIRDLLKERS